MENYQEITSGEEFTHDFSDWLSANMPIYREFERQAKMIASRRDHYSARTIIESMRHHSALSDSESSFRLNNNRTPDLARLFVIKNPQYQGFFQTRDSDKRLGLQS